MDLMKFVRILGFIIALKLKALSDLAFILLSLIFRKKSLKVWKKSGNKKNALMKKSAPGNFNKNLKNILIKYPNSAHLKAVFTKIYDISIKIIFINKQIPFFKYRNF